MHCNTFFHWLAAHMVTSKKCMLASQESLSHKRVCYKYDVDVVSEHDNNLQVRHDTVAKNQTYMIVDMFHYLIFQNH